MRSQLAPSPKGVLHGAAQRHSYGNMELRGAFGRVHGILRGNHSRIYITRRARNRVVTYAIRRFLTPIVTRAASIRPGQIAIPVGVGIAVLVVLGTLQRTIYPNWHLANLDSEASVATTFSALLLGAAALSWLLLVLVQRPVSRAVVSWAALLGLLALDEGNAFHEALERGTGIDWQILYLPILVLGGLIWQRVVRSYFPSQTATLLIAGAVVWAVTLVIELVQNWGGQAARAAIYDPAMITEEALEMIGSALILLAGMAGLRTWQQTERYPAP